MMGIEPGLHMCETGALHQATFQVYFSFDFGVRLSDAQGLILALHSELTPAGSLGCSMEG